MGEANIWQPRTVVNFSADTKQAEESFTAIAGQSLFFLQSLTYAVGTGSLSVHKNGLLLANNVDWAEQSAGSFSLVIPCVAGDRVVATALTAITGDVDVRDTDIFLPNYQSFRDYAGTETTAYAQGKVTHTDGGEGFFGYKSGASIGFYVDNNNTILVPTGGNGSAAWVRSPLTAILYDTLSEATTRQDLIVGSTVSIDDRGLGRFNVVTGATPNGYYIVAAANGLQLSLALNQTITARMFGVVGNYAADDTAAIDALTTFSSERGVSIDFEDLICRYTGTLNLLPSIKFKGNGAPKIATFPQFGGDKSKLRAGFKHLISGAAIIFDGTGAVATYNTNRSDSYSSFKPMATYLSHAPYSLSGIAFIQDMDVFDVGGTLTTAANDNRAVQYTAGMVIQSTLSSNFDFTLFGYWTVGGMIIHNQDGGSIDPDYNGFNNSILNGGLAVIGHDTAAGAAGEGMTGNRFVECGIYGADHHNRPDGYYTVPVVYIDGFLASSAGGTRGTTITGGNLRGYANDSVVTDHCDDFSLVNVVTEFSTLSGVANANAEGTFVGTINTKRFSAVALPATGGIGMSEYVAQITGPFQVMGAGGFDYAMFGQGGAGVRLSGSAGDGRVQITNNFASTVSGWVMRRDNAVEGLDFLLDNVVLGTISAGGGLRNSLFGMANTAQTIVAGAITLGTFNYISLAGEGGAADTLITVNGGSYDGELLILKSATSAVPITISESGGNIRLSELGDFLLDSSQDRITLQFDGINFVELSRSGNGE